MRPDAKWDVEKLDRLLDELAARYGIANLKMPSHGAVGLRLRDGSELYLEHASDQGRLYAYIGVMPLPKIEAQRLKLFGKMLDLNFLGVGTDCGVLSIQAETATLHRSFRIADLQFAALDKSLNELIAARNELAETLKLQGEISRAVRTPHSARTLLTSLRHEARADQADQADC